MIKSDLFLKEIESLREQLVILVKEKGYTDKETIKISQQLDIVLNQYDNLERNKLC